MKRFLVTAAATFTGVVLGIVTSAYLLTYLIG